HSHPPHLPSFPTRRSSDLDPRYTPRLPPDSALEPERRDHGADVAHPELGRPVCRPDPGRQGVPVNFTETSPLRRDEDCPVLATRDRKSTRLNSSHVSISYA